MPKITIRRTPLIKPEEIFPKHDASEQEREAWVRSSMFSTEYEVIGGERHEMHIVYSIPREKTTGMDVDPDVYLLQKNLFYFDRDQTGKIIPNSRKYLGKTIPTYALTSECAERKAYSLALKDAKDLIRGTNMIIDDQIGLANSKLETTLEELSENEGPSAMWDEQPGA